MLWPGANLAGPGGCRPVGLSTCCPTGTNNAELQHVTTTKDYSVGGPAGAAAARCLSDSLSTRSTMDPNSITSPSLAQFVCNHLSLTPNSRHKPPSTAQTRTVIEADNRNQQKASTPQTTNSHTAVTTEWSGKPIQGSHRTLSSPQIRACQASRLRHNLHSRL